MTTTEARRWRAALALMAASGFAGLGYQVVWTQQCALWLGHEAAAVLAVLAAFFGGLAVGALALAERIERSCRPGRWYAACEAVIAVWGAMMLWAAAPFSAWALTWIGAEPAPAWHWTVAFVATFVLLLPATAAMGATLPAIERVAAPLGAGGRSIAAFYASNTFGAVMGVLATAFWLVPTFGLARTAAVCIALNLLCAGVAWLAFSRRRDRPEPRPAATAATAATPTAALARLACTGALGIGYEVVVVRVLGQVAEDTVYTFALLLAVYLAGTSLGAAAYARWCDAGAGRRQLGERLLAALAVACLAGDGALWAAEWLRDAAQQGMGGGMAAALAGEATLAAAAFALPTFVMGALFSHLMREAGDAGVSFGRGLGVNTLGAAVAPPLFGVLLAPWLGAKATLVIIALGYVALALRSARFSPMLLVPAGIAAAVAVLAPRLAFVDVPAGGRIVSYEEGALAAVSVVEDRDGVARLRIDNREQEGSSASLFVDARQALLPMLLHPDPHRALFLGLGTGVTASSAAEEPAVEVDAVELLPEVITASQRFTAAFHDGTPNPHLHLIAADARRFVRGGGGKYDVVVADNFHPARSGSGALYTVEHFSAVRERLAPHGLFCQWLPLHQLDLATVRSIVRSFMAVYPEGAALLASNSLQTPVIGLVGRADGERFDVAALGRRLHESRYPEPPAAFGIDDELALLGSFVAGPHALAAFAGDAPANTDDRPVVAYRAPRIAYEPGSLPADRLSALLHALALEPAELVAAGTDPAWTARLGAYAQARLGFIDAGRGVVPSADVAAMLAQVRAPLLAVLHTSPDFRPAYDPLLRMATALGRRDPAAARVLLAELGRVQPARPEASALLATRFVAP